MVELQLKEGPLSLFYACPKYYKDNRKIDEKKCDNRLSLEEYNKAIEHVVNLLSEAENEGSLLNLTNYKWKKNGIEYKVIKHTDTEIKITILNKRYIGKYSKF